jgi:hypothetical protein
VAGTLEELTVLVTPDLLATLLDYAAHLILTRELISPENAVNKEIKNIFIPDSSHPGKEKKTVRRTEASCVPGPWSALSPADG